MRRKYTRGSIYTVPATRAAADKAEKSINMRAVGRGRRIRRHAGLSRFLVVIHAFILQIKKRSPRAIAVLGILAVLVIGLPVTLILAAAGNKDKAVALPQDEPSERMVLDTQTFSGPGALEADSVLPSPTPEPHPKNGIDIKRGMNAPVVMEIQERLMELGFMDWDEPTDFFGPNTREAVRLFQRQHGLNIDGAVGLQTYEALFADTAQKYTITVGIEDDDVHALQVRLRELGYINKATSYFGDETEAAVKKFQERNGLSPDGKVGESTREMLYSESAKAHYFERGEVSETLRKYQNRLKELGYLTSSADGTYGKDTETAVKRFQERTGLIADGYLGPTTISELMSKNAQANAIIVGMNGPEVEKIQKRLKELGYLSGTPDGRYGEKTETAVRNFQNQHKLSVDGKVGKQTMNLLMSDKAKKSDGSAAKPGGSSGGSGGSSGGSASIPKANGANVESFIAMAESRVGSPYKRGAKGPSSFDCSGFVYWCLNQVGVKQGYMTSASWQKTDRYQRISGMNNLQRGDVVSFKGHVGIYLGGGRMIDASSGEGKVRICTNIQGSAYWNKTFKCGYRIF